jgi:hypothetical protein
MMIIGLYHQPMDLLAQQPVDLTRHNIQAPKEETWSFFGSTTQQTMVDIIYTYVLAIL